MIKMYMLLAWIHMLHGKEWFLISWPHQKLAGLNWHHKIVKNIPACKEFNTGDETMIV